MSQKTARPLGGDVREEGRGRVGIGLWRKKLVTATFVSSTVLALLYNLGPTHFPSLSTHTYTSPHTLPSHSHFSPPSTHTHTSPHPPNIFTPSYAHTLPSHSHFSTPSPHTHRFTSCFIKRILASRGQHFLLLYPTMFSLLGSGCTVRYLWMRSRASSAVNLQRQ